MPEIFQKIIKNILRDIQVELTDEFDQNFERQAFFSEAWQRRKSPIRNEGRAILTDTGQLRRSIKSRTTDNSVIFYTDLPYAEIHNEGGEIIVTQRMKRFFWHKYYEATGAFSRKKSGKTGKTATAGNHEADLLSPQRAPRRAPLAARPVNPLQARWQHSYRERHLAAEDAEIQECIFWHKPV